jgi:hypothetical protein
MSVERNSAVRKLVSCSPKKSTLQSLAHRPRGTLYAHGRAAQEKLNFTFHKPLKNKTNLSFDCFEETKKYQVGPFKHLKNRQDPSNHK